MAKQSKSFGNTRAFRQHILAGHDVGLEVRDLRSDVEEGFENNEARAGFPHLDWIDVSEGALLAAGGDVTLKGRNLLQGQTVDALTCGIGTASVIFTNLKPGISGFSVVIVQGAGALAVGFADNLLTITLATGGSTAAQVATAVNDIASECYGIVRATTSGGGGGTVLVKAETKMAGGAGLYAGNKVWVAGVEALPKHAATPWTDTAITVTVPALTGLAASDIVTVLISSDGVCSESLSGVLA